MDVGQYLAGVLFLALELGGSAFAAETVRRRRLGHLSGAARLAAQALLTTIALAVTVLVPGVLGILTRGTASGCGLLLAAAAFVVPAAEGQSTNPDPAPAPAGRVSIAIASLAVLCAGGVVVAEFLHRASAPMAAVDLTSFDLPEIARWIQTGSLWHITELYPLQSHGTYPQNAHLVVAAIVLAFHNEALVRFFSYPFIAFAAVAAYAAALEVGARRSLAAALAAALVAMPSITTSVEFVLDPVALAGFITGVAFLLRYRRTTLTSDLVLAGLGLGFAAGSFWYYSDTVVVLVLTWGAWRWWSVRLNRRTIRELGTVLGVIAACLGFWLLRNLLLTGDPVYPVRVAAGPVAIFNAPHDIYRALFGFSIVHYAGNSSVLRHFILPAVETGVGGLGVVVLAAVAWCIGSFVLGPRARRRTDRLNAWLAITAIVLAAIYVLTPYSAFGLVNRPGLAIVNVRYLIPALVLGTILVASIATRASARARFVIEVAVLAAAVEEAHRAYTILGPSRTSLVVGAVIVVALAITVGCWRRIGGSGQWALAGIAAAGVISVGYGTQRSYNRERYAHYDATYAWIQQHPATRTVGLAGARTVNGPSVAWAMFGPRLANRVFFVGRLDHGDHVTQYQTRGQWLGALRDGRYDVVEIARNEIEPATTDSELRWAAQAKLPILSRSTGFELVCAAALWRAPARPYRGACV